MRTGNSIGIGLLFIALALILAGLAAHPGMRRKCRWGRTASSIPMSVMGLATWIGAFLLVAATSFGLLPFLTLFAVIPILAMAALFDSYRNSRSKNNPPRD